MKVTLFQATFRCKYTLFQATFQKKWGYVVIWLYGYVCASPVGAQFFAPAWLAPASKDTRSPCRGDPSGWPTASKDTRNPCRGDPQSAHTAFQTNRTKQTKMCTLCRFVRYVFPRHYLTFYLRPERVGRPPFPRAGRHAFVIPSPPCSLCPNSRYFSQKNHYNFVITEKRFTFAHNYYALG
jgi:hypothetical protein